MLTTMSIAVLFAAQLASFGASADGEPQTPAPGAKPLFADHEALNLSLETDFDALCRPREEEDCDYAPTTLTWRTGDDVEYNIPVEILVRGGWRARRSNCSIPPLFMRFSDEETAGTPFSGQTLLPLTTHCQSESQGIGRASGRDYEQYVLREYLGYRLYNMLSDSSLGVRLLRITYANPAKPADSDTRYAFFTEHFNDMAARLQADVLPRHSFDHEKIDLTALDRVSLFNFMIGNTDSSVVRQRNVVLIGTEDGVQIPVPFDLDMSGLVNAEYSGVSPRLDFRDPRKRHYLGFCYPQLDLEPLFAHFIDKKEAMVTLVNEIPGMRVKNRNESRGYLKGFFRTIESPKRRQKAIIDACYPWPPSPDDHTTPPDAQ